MKNIVSSHEDTQHSEACNCQHQDVIPVVHSALIGVSDDAILSFVDACLCNNTLVLWPIRHILSPVNYSRFQTYPLWCPSLDPETQSFALARVERVGVHE
jgi:hypothetical protein